ncbi:PIG-L family deacetylase [Sutcliffiella rhizosphaerae]|uniref:PIG-L family deacetylase n=1 Tax=Sutcliffiella rhizosphaerae TaxID=2880967 RepID=A0ABM8YN35_9BACI|nr:PIG-L family deacetylase [Sutcliffiella rhizosphaerae]CAG9621404.1 hypothetical protein BACCIP111883_02177 [Sutcliffiella rhizosphaerae]
MKKLLILIFIILTGCSSKNDRLEVFYAPHADDEVLSLGPAIIQALDDSDEVHIVLLSEGKASKAINTVNELLSKDGYPPLTKEDFGQARVREFKASIQSLGVSPESITILDLPDGSISIDKVKEIIIAKESLHTTVTHHVMSEHDPHDDHASTGKALRELLDEKLVNEGKFYIPIQEHKKLSYDETVNLTKKVHQRKLDEALNSYSVWNPSEGNYSIGKISVPDYFIMVQEGMESRYHY